MDHLDCSRSCFGYNIILISYDWHCHNDLSVLQKVSVQIQNNNYHDSLLLIIGPLVVDHLKHQSL